MKPKIPVYLDHAATTPTRSEVLAAMKPYLEGNFFNPSSLYGASRRVRSQLEAARKRVAVVLGAKPTEIVFTAGGTESANLAVLGVARRFKGSRVVASAIEHSAVLESLKVLTQEGHSVKLVGVGKSGLIKVEDVLAAIDDNTVLVSVMYANNEMGTIQPITEISQAILKIRADRLSRGVRLPLYLHSDACQAGSFLDLHVSRLGVDLLTLNGSKIYGPKQTGCLYVRTGTELVPQIVGGGQEKGRRSGTENVAGIIGFATALELAHGEREIESRRLSELRDRLWAGIHTAIPSAKLNGDPKRRLPNNLNLTIPEVEGETMVLYLDEAGVMVSTASACSTGELDPSHVLLAIGLSDDEANSSLRLTLGRATTEAEVEYVIALLPKIVTRLRALDR